MYEYSTDMKGAKIEVLGIERGNGTKLTKTHNKTFLNSNKVSTHEGKITLFNSELRNVLCWLWIHIYAPSRLKAVVQCSPFITLCP